MLDSTDAFSQRKAHAQPSSGQALQQLPQEWIAGTQSNLIIWGSNATRRSLVAFSGLEIQILMEILWILVFHNQNGLPPEHFQGRNGLSDSSFFQNSFQFCWIGRYVYTSTY